MSWQVSGRSMELCSCSAFCPCWLGPEGKPDKEWCSGIFGFEVEAGNADGIDLAGGKVVFMAHWPGNFFAGNGRARLFIDDAASAEQRRELEAIFSGKKGGLPEGLFGAVISSWHPARIGKVQIEWGHNPKVRVAGVGGAKLKPFKDAAGKSATLSGAAAQGAFQIESMVLAQGSESSWSDPDLGDWKVTRRPYTTSTGPADEEQIGSRQARREAVSALISRTVRPTKSG